MSGGEVQMHRRVVMTLLLLAATLPAVAALTAAPASALLPSGNPFGHFESAFPGPTNQVNAATIQVNGWVIDPDTTAPADVAVYLNGAWQSQTTADMARPDVGAAFPDYGDDHGFSITIPVGLDGGGTGYVTDTVCVFGINTGPGTANTYLGCKSVTFALAGWGGLQGVSSVVDQVTVWGWFIDPMGAQGQVEIWVDGKLVTNAYSTADGPGVARLFPLYPNNNWSATFTLTAGVHTVCAVGLTGLTVIGSHFGCRGFVVGGTPHGHLESVTYAAGRVTASGWALDPDTTGPIDVIVYFTSPGQATRGIRAIASNSRPDVAAAYPGYGADHGFSVSVVIPPGTWWVETAAVNAGTSLGVTGFLPGSRPVTVP
jgi:hypothetical protein